MIKVSRKYFKIVLLWTFNRKNRSAMLWFNSLQVHHSQHANKTSLKTWVLLKADGEIETAHCTCTASLGEACSLFASLLFYVEAFNRTRKATTCTQEQCKWMLPKVVEEVPYLPIAEIDFKGATRKMQDLNFGSNGKEESHGPVEERK